MRYRLLGRSGLVVSEVGLGGWAIGGQGWGPVDDATSIAAVRAAVDRGVAFIDTADVYGDGHGEEVLGEALDGRREAVVLATKAGLLSPSGSDFRPGYIRAALEGSLRRLRTDWVDVLQLHNPPRAALTDDDLWQTLRDLKEEGKVRSFGASVRTTADAVLAIERGGVDTVQVTFNVLDQAARSLFPVAERERVGLIARLPLASGFLTGKYQPSHQFRPGDYRRAWSAKRRARAVEGAEALAPVAREAGASRAQAAIAFDLSYSAVAVTIPGVKTPDQARENSAASAFAPLDPAFLRRLECLADGSGEED